MTVALKQVLIQKSLGKIPEYRWLNLKLKLPDFRKKFKTCQKWNFTKKCFDLFDFTSFFAWTFLNFLTRCVRVLINYN